MRIPVFLFPFFLAACPVQAADTGAELKQVESDLKFSQSRQQELAGKRSEIEDKLSTLGNELIALGRNVQEHELVVTKLGKKQQETSLKINAIHADLDKEREDLARLVTALQRLARVPPQAMLARPAAPVDMARSFLLMQQVMPVVAEKAAEIKTALTQLEALYDTQAAQRQEMLEEQNALNVRKNDLEKRVTQRKALLKSTQTEEEKTAQETAALSSRAGNLRELLDQLAKQEALDRAREEAKRKDKEAAKRTAIPPIKEKIREWLGGPASLPVAGQVETLYGDKIAGGGASQGMHITANPGAIVTAPDPGTIRFAGPFRQYKLLVIIQHDNGEHSLLGGLQELYTSVGAKVVKGEPLGKLPPAKSSEVKMEGDSGPATSLYYERRRNGKPIDPRKANG